MDPSLVSHSQVFFCFLGSHWRLFPPKKHTDPKRTMNILILPVKIPFFYICCFFSMFIYKTGRNKKRSPSPERTTQNKQPVSPKVTISSIRRFTRFQDLFVYLIGTRAGGLGVSWPHTRKRRNYWSLQMVIVREATPKCSKTWGLGIIFV